MTAANETRHLQVLDAIVDMLGVNRLSICMLLGLVCVAVWWSIKTARYAMECRDLAERILLRLNQLDTLADAPPRAPVSGKPKLTLVRGMPPRDADASTDDDSASN